ncbi:MAG: sigma-70 family RNA polymerase sigma factor [Bacteroidetes bacterium]|nr:sigma-70 family RNA polymerase sigma factor [Bacteroidota bacterium]
MKSTSVEIIWKDFHDRLLGFIQKRVGQSVDPEDILQDVFEKVQLKIHTLKDDSKLTPWLYRITNNAIIDHFRNKFKPAELVDDVVSDDEDIHHFKELGCCLEPFIEQLATDEQDLLQKHLAGLSQLEHSKELGIPYSTLKSRMKKARMNLKQTFFECCHFKIGKGGGIVDVLPRKQVCVLCG